MKKYIIDNEFCFKLIIISIFLFNYSIRERFIPVIKDVNILFYISLLMLAFINKKNISKSKILGIIILLVYNIFINTLTGSRINNVLYFNIQTIFPLIILTIKFDECINNKKELILKIVNFYNFFILILFAIYVVDFITGNTVSKALTSLFTAYGQNWISSSVFNSRYHFFFAHPLYSSVLVMSFYIINLMCYKFNIKTSVSYWNFHIISALLLLSMSCKTPIIIFTILFCIFNFTPKRLVFASLLTASLYFSGKANYIINRFLTEGSLTSGRNEALSKILPELISPKNIFFGKGENLQYYITNRIGAISSAAAQEYPVLVYFFRYGLIFTLLLLNFLIIYPIKKCLKKRNYVLIIGIVSLFLEICMFNGLTSLVEVQIVYMIFLILISMINENSKKEGD